MAPFAAKKDVVTLEATLFAGVTNVLEPTASRVEVEHVG